MNILVLNGGSSSFKCWYGETENESAPSAPFWTAHIDLAAEGIQALEPTLRSFLQTAPQIHAVGHRIVHGGKVYREPAVITPEVRAAIAQQAEFAPAHNRFELEAIECVDRVIGPGARQIAVFDTGFHESLAPAAYVYAGPYAWLEQGIRRYGFHGISYQYASRRAAEILGRDPSGLRLVICHLGNGSSLCAVRDGKSVDTTMGFTPLEGLMMGARCGSIDPGIMIYLLRHGGYNADQLDNVLNHDSGLKGVSGISGDMRDILAGIEKGNERAKLAFDIYAHRLCREIGGMIAVLGGADALVFTGGVGENCAPLREIVSRQFEFLGPGLRVLVIHAEEELEIARACYRITKEQECS